MYDGTSALFITSQNGHIEVVIELIATGAKIDLQKDSGASVFFIARQEGRHIEVIRELIAKKDLQKDDGASALYLASQNGHIEVVREVIAKVLR